MTQCHGILLVDKPVGLTSFGVVDKVRRTLTRAVPALQRSRAGSRHRLRFKCGHAGSLDPLATGLLILMCGHSTRLSPFLMGLDKSYTATVRLGVTTTTLDAEGEVTETQPVDCSHADLAIVLTRFHGRLQQVPPLYAAIKHKGQPLYKRVRRGEVIPPLAPRSVDIARIEITATRWAAEPGEGEPTAPDGRIYEVDLALDCSSGTYVRSLARDLAAAVGTVGHIRRLRRTRVGPFDLADAVPSDRIEDPEVLTQAFVPMPEALPHLPTMSVSDDEAHRLRQGGQPEIGWLRRLDRPLANTDEFDVHFRIVEGAGGLVAVGKLPAAGGPPRTAAVFPALAQETGSCG